MPFLPVLDEANWKCIMLGWRMTKAPETAEVCWKIELRTVDVGSLGLARIARPMTLTIASERCANWLVESPGDTQ